MSKSKPSEIIKEIARQKKAQYFEDAVIFRPVTEKDMIESILEYLDSKEKN